MDRLIRHRGFKALAFLGGSARADVRDRHRPRPRRTGRRIINYAVDHAARDSSWALPRRADRDAAAGATRCAPSAFGGRAAAAAAAGRQLGRRAWQRRAEPRAQCAQAGGRGRRAERRRRRQARRPGAPATLRRPVPVGGGEPAVRSSDSDGLLRTLRVTATAPIACRRCPFLPANARPSRLIFVDGVRLHEHLERLRRRAERRLGDRSLTPRARSRCRGKPTAGNVAGTAGPDARNGRHVFVLALAV